MARKPSPGFMAKRNDFSDKLDFYPTPPWATRALLQKILWSSAEDPLLPLDTVVWEPAAGRGDMAVTLREYGGYKVIASDVVEHDPLPGFRLDFVKDYFEVDARSIGAQAIITNPPFSMAKEFLLKAFREVRFVAMLLRLSFLESADRYEAIWMYPQRRPTHIFPFASRLYMRRGYTKRSSGSAIAFAWFVWDGQPGRLYDGRTVIDPIAPNAQSYLEVEGDYDVV